MVRRIYREKFNFDNMSIPKYLAVSKVRQTAFTSLSIITSGMEHIKTDPLEKSKGPVDGESFYIELFIDRGDSFYVGVIMDDIFFTVESTLNLISFQL